MTTNITNGRTKKPKEVRNFSPEIFELKETTKAKLDRDKEDFLAFPVLRHIYVERYQKIASLSRM
ncbi:hypothetical protein KIN20_025968 [Parelaphostrongylus tenuis]|uniref:Uncharacterized protein n=1 Tax=Parelaphostrongylus tenuis TaxID=148309 RepID=A0AAD5QX89_PARTN|nr:hypothetical protein KIN20_025968 [Parelaphostrongylus tenuis]